MKEKIYTIPINEAFEQECECPLCCIERRLEKEAVEYELGPAMMEPDHRELTNKKGFCNKHFDMMFASPNKLPLALVMDTHLECIRKEMEKLEAGNKKGIFNKKTEKRSMSEVLASCVICDRVSGTMQRYYNVLMQMWHEDKEFREKWLYNKCWGNQQIELENNKKILKKVEHICSKSCIMELSRNHDRRNKYALQLFYIKFNRIARP